MSCARLSVPRSLRNAGRPRHSEWRSRSFPIDGATGLTPPQNHHCRGSGRRLEQSWRDGSNADQPCRHPQDQRRTERETAARYAKAALHVNVEMSTTSDASTTDSRYPTTERADSCRPPDVNSPPFDHRTNRTNDATRRGGRRTTRDIPRNERANVRLNRIAGDLVLS